MKIKGLIVYLAVLLFGIPIATVAEEASPGGVVYTDGREIIYHDARTGEQRNLIADLPGSGGFAVKAATVCPNGRTLVFLDGANRLWGRTLPYGKPYLIEADKASVGQRLVDSTGITRRTWVENWTALIPDNIPDTFSASSGVYGISYEFIRKAEGLKEVPGNSEEHLRRVTQRIPDGLLTRYGGRTNLSAYIPIMDTFRAVTAVGIRGETIDEFPQHFGNPILYPRQFPYLAVTTRDRQIRTIDEDEPGYASISRGSETVRGSETFPYSTRYGYQEGAGISQEEAQRCFGIKRNAYFPAWHPEEQWLAVIYQTENGWGPIEIRNCWPSKWLSPTWLGQPTRVNLDVSLENCEGLTWRPDGSISYLSEGNVHIIDSEQITEGIKNSRLRWEEAGRRARARGLEALANLRLSPDIHWFKVNPQPVARGVNGNRLQWVSNSSFIFRGNDGVVYIWQNNQTKRLFSVPENFTYCPPTAFVVSSGRIKVSGWKIFNLGVIQTGLSGAGTIGSHGWTSLSVRLDTDRSDLLECAHIQELDIIALDDIKDPAQYDYMTPEGGHIGEGVYRIPSVKIHIGQIVLLRSVNGYAAIKLLKIDDDYFFECKFWPRDVVEKR